MAAALRVRLLVVLLDFLAALGSSFPLMSMSEITSWVEQSTSVGHHSIAAALSRTSPRVTRSGYTS